MQIELMQGNVVLARVSSPHVPRKILVSSVVIVNLARNTKPN